MAQNVSRVIHISNQTKEIHKALFLTRNFSVVSIIPAVQYLNDKAERCLLHNSPSNKQKGTKNWVSQCSTKICQPYSAIKCIIARKLDVHRDKKMQQRSRDSKRYIYDI